MPKKLRVKSFPLTHFPFLFEREKGGERKSILKGTLWKLQSIKKSVDVECYGSSVESLKIKSMKLHCGNSRDPAGIFTLGN